MNKNKKIDHLFTHYKKKDFTECDGVDLLSFNLRKKQRIYPHFYSNDKRPVYDGEFDFLDEKMAFIRTFRCQIKTRKKLGKSFNIEVKYLSAVKNKISLDPLFFFVIELDTKKIYYIDLSLYDFSSDLNEKGLRIDLHKFTILEIDSFIKLLNSRVVDREDSFTPYEFKTINNGIAYLNNAFEKYGYIKNFLFPKLFSFAVEYYKDIDYDKIKIVPIKEEKKELVKIVLDEKRLGPLEFQTVSFRKNSINNATFRDCLESYFDIFFSYYENFVEFMPKIIISEVVYAALEYEYKDLNNNDFKELFYKESIAIEEIKKKKISINNKFYRCLMKIYELGHDDFHKVWKYRDNYDESNKNFLKSDFEMFIETIIASVKSSFSRLKISNVFFSSKYYKINNNDLIVFPRNEYQNIDKIEDFINNINIKIMKLNVFDTYAPLFASVLYYIKKAIYEENECKFNGIQFQNINVEEII